MIDAPLGRAQKALASGPLARVAKDLARTDAPLAHAQKALATAPLVRAPKASPLARHRVANMAPPATAAAPRAR